MESALTSEGLEGEEEALRRVFKAPWEEERRVLEGAAGEEGTGKP